MQENNGISSFSVGGMCLVYLQTADPPLQSDRHIIIMIFLGLGFLATHYVWDNYVPDLSDAIS